jgi:hypothetical protein
MYAVILKRVLPILAGMLYVVSPVDLVPDFIPGFGWVDDLVVILAVTWYLFKQRGQSPWDFLWRRVGGPRPGRAEAPRPEDRTADFSRMDPYALLELSRGAGAEEIKAAYKRAVGRYHPDKVAHLGPEFQELAHRKLLAIQQAYADLQGRH